MDNVERFFEKLKSLFDDHARLKEKNKELEAIVLDLSKRVAKLEKSHVIEHGTFGVSAYLNDMQNSFGSHK